MDIARIIGISVNAVAVLLSLVSCFSLGVLAWMFLGSISSSDKVIGMIGFAIIPVLLVISVISLMFVMKKTGIVFRICFGIGIAEIVFYGISAKLIWSAIEAAARP